MDKENELLKLIEGYVECQRKFLESFASIIASRASEKAIESFIAKTETEELYPENKWVTKRQLMEYLQIGPNTLNDWINKGYINSETTKGHQKFDLNKIVQNARQN